jgi:hypothetical protein
MVSNSVLQSISNYLICEVKTSDTLEIRSRKDYTFSDALYVVLYTSAMPSSSTANVTLYERYISGSDHSRSS